MDELVFAAVVAARFLVPLAIPRFPLPAILLAAVLDAGDQSLLAAFDVEPANYQGYDKALDIYYLSIAYISTIRNWTDGVPFRIGQLLWYYRLVGVVAFELSGARALLLIFPNTFEYFFIFYEAVRVRWEPSRLANRTVIGVAAAIWLVIKLPQEWWIHIAQLDVTDVLGRHPWAWSVPAALLAVFAVTARALAARLPPPDWVWSLAVDTHATTAKREPADPQTGRWARLDHPILEKTVLVGLVATIFVQLVPEADASLLQIVGVVGVLVAANAGIHTVLVHLGAAWETVWSQLAANAVVNGLIAVGLSALQESTRTGRLGGTGPTLFLVALLTLIVTLYDRYRYTRILSVWLPASPPGATP